MSDQCMFCKKTVYKNSMCEGHYETYIEHKQKLFEEDKKAVDFKTHYHNLKHKIYNMITYPHIVDLCIKLIAIADLYYEKYDKAELKIVVVNDVNKIIRYKVKQIKENREIMDSRYSKLFNDIDFRNKWKKDIKTEDGHYVRSRAEQLIDNFLYHNNIVHAYEKLIILPFQNESTILCDFYIPEINTYIEYYGKYDEEYIARKHAKEQIYKENNLNHIALGRKDLDNLDDILMREILIRRIQKKKGQQ